MRNALFAILSRVKHSDGLWKKLNRTHDALLLIMFSVVIFLSAYVLYDNWYILSHASDAHLLQYKPDSPSYQADESPITDEMVGWLTIDHTSIDYPVMQGGNNLTFLNRNPYGEFSLSGSIFLDSRNSPDFSDEYSIIYGHHMAYGKLFGSLDAFLDEPYASSHRSGTLLIGREGQTKRRLTVVAVLRADVRNTDLFNVEHPQNALEAIASHADIKLDKPGAKIVVLSTCDGESDSMRILVVCNLD